MIRCPATRRVEKEEKAPKRPGLHCLGKENSKVGFSRLIACFSTALLAGLLVGGVAHGQPASSVQSAMPSPADETAYEKEIVWYPLKPSNTSSPRATLQSFLDSVSRSYRALMEAHRENTRAGGWSTPLSVQRKAQRAEDLFQRGAYCLDLTKVPTALKREMAYERTLQLKEILDRIELPPFGEIPDATAIEQEEEEEKFPELHRWRLPNTNIVIARVEEGPRKGEFLFTPETVDRLERYYRKVEYLPYKPGVSASPGFFDFYISTPGRLLPPKWNQWLPAWSRHRHFSLTVWQWLAFAVVWLAALLIVRVGYRRLVSRASTRSPVSRHRRRILFCLLCASTLLAVHYITGYQCNITGSTLIVMRIIFIPIWWLLAAAATLSGALLIAEKMIASPRIDPEGIQASYLRALFGVLGFLAATGVFVFGLSRLGISLLPLLTGLGIGGLAIALAARPTIENVIASFMIFADKPYLVGERVTVLGQMGDVESIGVRSTKIRLLTGPLMVIPNEKMAAMEIENIGRRPYIRRSFSINITYDTPPDKIRRAVQIVREILAVPGGAEGSEEQEPHPNEAINQWDFPPRIFFNEFNADSLNIYISYWYHPPDWWEAMEFAHRVNMRIKERFNAEGIDFAFPTQTLHLAGDKKRPLTIGHREVSEGEMS